MLNVHFVLKWISDPLKARVYFLICYQLQEEVLQMFHEGYNCVPIHVLSSSYKKISKCQKTVELCAIERVML